MKKLIVILSALFLSVPSLASIDDEFEQVLDSSFQAHVVPIPSVSLHHTKRSVLEAIHLKNSPRLDEYREPSPDVSYPSIIDEVQSRHLPAAILRKEKLNVLSIDGGGIRGILPLIFLAELEQRTGKRAYEMFDVIAGTSTGGMIALGLSLASASEILQLYVEQGGNLFRRNWNICGPKYNSTMRRQIFRDFFGKHKLSDAKIPTIVTAWELGRDKAYHLYSKWPIEGAFNHEHLDMLMSDAALATSAAPTYFEPEKIYPIRVNGERTNDSYTFLDGGVFANNPSMIALNYAMAMYPGVTHTDINLLSLGTGYRAPNYNADHAREWTRLRWLAPLLHVLLSGNSTSTDSDLSLLLKSKYNRVTIDLKFASKMLDKTGKNLVALLRDGARMIKKNKTTLDKWVAQFKELDGQMVEVGA